MSNDDDLELFDEQLSVVLPQSRLHHVDAIGIGSADVLSLTAFLLTLADSHCVFLRDLIRHEIFPQLKPTGSFHRPSGLFDLNSTWWKSCGPALNGLHNSAREWVNVIEGLTQHRGLHALTMVAWANVISFKSLLRHSKAWCDQCFEEMRTSGRPIYEPLLWSIEIIRVCPHHQIPLREKCPFPDCGRTIPTLTSQMLMGFCPYCKRWLGTPLPIFPEVQPNNMQAQLNIAVAVGEMLAVAPYLDKFPMRDRLGTEISKFIRNELENNFSEAARQFELSHKSVHNLANGNQSPQLGTIMKICDVMKRSPVELLIGQLPKVLGLTDFRDGVPPGTSQRRPRKFDEHLVREQLQNVIEQNNVPPPFLTEIAQTLNYDIGYLNKRVPDLCQIILDRRRDYEGEQQELRDAYHREFIYNTARSLTLEGIYPSKGKLAARGCVWWGTTYTQYWKDVLVELGWKAHQLEAPRED